jgi:hypothetical protein
MWSRTDSEPFHSPPARVYDGYDTRENEQHADDCGSDPRPIALRMKIYSMVSKSKPTIRAVIRALPLPAAFVTLPETDLTVRAEYTLRQGGRA